MTRAWRLDDRPFRPWAKVAASLFALVAVGAAVLPLVARAEPPQGCDWCAAINNWHGEVEIDTPHVDKMPLIESAYYTFMKVEEGEADLKIIGETIQAKVCTDQFEGKMCTFQSTGMGEVELKVTAGGDHKAVVRVIFGHDERGKVGDKDKDKGKPGEK